MPRGAPVKAAPRHGAALPPGAWCQAAAVVVVVVVSMAARPDPLALMSRFDRRLQRHRSE
jgi:hypothetical protein